MGSLFNVPVFCNWDERSRYWSDWQSTERCIVASRRSGKSLTIAAQVTMGIAAPDGTRPVVTGALCPPAGVRAPTYIITGSSDSWVKAY